VSQTRCLLSTQTLPATLFGQASRARNERDQSPWLGTRLNPRQPPKARCSISRHRRLRPLCGARSGGQRWTAWVIRGAG